MIRQDEINEAIRQFPTTFELRGVAGIFRISSQHSYFNDAGVLMLYTEILGRHGEWLSYAKGTFAELSNQIRDYRGLINFRARFAQLEDSEPHIKDTGEFVAQENQESSCDCLRDNSGSSIHQSWCRSNSNRC